jgi:hypothetical protein
VNLLAEKITKIEEFLNKQAQESEKSEKSEKSIQKTETSKAEGRSKISGIFI